MGWWRAGGEWQGWRGKWEPLEEWKAASWKVYPTAKLKKPKPTGEWKKPGGEGKGGKWSFAGPGGGAKKKVAPAETAENAEKEKDVNEEELVAQRQRRTFLEVVLGTAKTVQMSYAEQTSSAAQEEAAQRIESLRKAFDAMGPDAVVSTYKQHLRKTSKRPWQTPRPPSRRRSPLRA